MPEILASILASLAGAGALTISLIKLFGNKLLDHQFSKGLEKYKFKINSQFDRISKIHEKEFEVLPLIWELIQDARTALYSLSHPKPEYPDLDAMNGSELNEYLLQTEFTEIEKEKLRKAIKKVPEFIVLNYVRKLRQISHAIAEFDRAFQRNKIFLTKELTKSLWELRSDCIQAYLILRDSWTGEVLNLDQVGKAFSIIEGHAKLMEEVAGQIQARLRFDEAY